MGLPLRDRLGALQERDFRLLFTATTITTLGDAVATIALTFAVLKTLDGSTKQLGVVVAARLIASSAVVLAGGAIADRLPRHLVIVGASLVQGLAQAATAALLLTGHATVALVVGFQVLYGVGDGFVLPAEVGLIPQTVSPERLQPANALQGLTRNVVFVVGPPIGGVLVVLGSPGLAIAIDAASFFAAAVVMLRIQIPRRVAEHTAGYLHELREGWREFSSRTWLWSTVVVFGLGNIFFMFWGILGPTVLKDHPLSWALISGAGAAGAIVGGLVAIRYRPKRPLVASIVIPIPFVFRFIALAFGAPVWLVALASFVGGVGIAVHLALWYTVFQREVPEHAQSRVSSYDVLGSFVLTPLGTLIAAPVAALAGIDNALLIAAGAIIALNLSMLLIPSVWSIRDGEPATTMAAA